MQAQILEHLTRGQSIATVRSIFGQVTKEFFATDDGVVIGKSVSPMNQTGSRILHLGLNPRLVPCVL